jgi:hypothetical protein
MGRSTGILKKTAQVFQRLRINAHFLLGLTPR